MPKELERKLWREAKEKFPKDVDRQRRYVYGTLDRVKPSKKKSGERRRRRWLG